MTADEARMAWALVCSPEGVKGMKSSQHKAAMRMLHARSLTAGRSISAPEARLLRSCVLALAKVLPADVVQLAGGVT